MCNQYEERRTQDYVFTIELSEYRITFKCVVLLLFLFLFFSSVLLKMLSLLDICTWLGTRILTCQREARGRLTASQANEEFVELASLVVLYEVMIYNLGITFPYNL